MGEELRSVHSLSGGESFLVSLSLALGLASLTSERVRVESLFIDQGFGSLDPDTLNVAMGALMQLESQGRKVGVISHVQEMTDAIPVQIPVQKGRGGTSRIVILGSPCLSDSEDRGGICRVDSPAGESVGENLISEVAVRMKAVLQREAVAGRAKVSTRALRDELGRSPKASCERGQRLQIGTHDHEPTCVEFADVATAAILAGFAFLCLVGIFPTFGCKPHVHFDRGYRLR